MTPGGWFFIIFVVGLYFWAAWASQRYFKAHPLDPAGKVKPVLIRGKFSPLLTMFQMLRSGQYFNLLILKLQRSLALSLEIMIVLLWAIYVGRSFLDLNPNYVPRGGEFPLSISEDYFWKDLFRCGGCALWNGRSIGGYPALIDLQGAPLHPAVAIPTLLFGAINGGKVAVVLSLMLAGLAQLWLGYLLGLGSVARLWAAVMAVIAGTITGRMELGLITLVVSTASGALVIPAAIYLVQQRSTKAVVLFAFSLSLLILAGQGYIQVCVALSVFPALLILFVGPKNQMVDLAKKFALAGVLTLLLCAVFLLPLAHSWPRFVKDTDASLKLAQPIDYQLLNLVIHDFEFYKIDILGKMQFPYTFVNFIGLTPFLFILFAIRFVRREKLRYLFFFISATALVYLNSSAILPRLLFDQFNHQFLIGLRNLPLMTGMAGPLLLGLAGWGLDLALRNHSLHLTLGSQEHRSLVHLPVSWVLLAVPILASISIVYDFNIQWLDTLPLADEAASTMQAIKPVNSQWVSMPHENFWILPAYENDIKLLSAFHPFNIKNTAQADGYVEGVREDPQNPIENKLFELAGVVITHNQANDYAALKTPQGDFISCPAVSTGGSIDLYCPDNPGGELVVRENNWSGWTAFVNSQPQPIITGPWLKLYLSPGQQNIQFRYIPWDVPLGLLLSLLGFVLAAVLWRRRPATDVRNGMGTPNKETSEVSPTSEV